MVLYTAAEDSQPNEQRQSRKGFSNVPTIRVVSDSRRRGSSGRPPRGSVAQHHAARYEQASTSRSSYTGGNHASPALKPSRGRPYSTQHAQTRLHRPSDSANKRPSTFPEDHQAKRTRINSPAMPSTPRCTPAIAQTAMNPGARQEIMLDLPQDCQTGVTGCKLARRQWRERETCRLEQDGQSEVYHVESLDRHMRFFCRTKSTLQMQSQSGPEPTCTI